MPRTLAGVCDTHDKPGWQANVLRLFDVFVDGLRTRHGGAIRGDNAR